MIVEFEPSDDDLDEEVIEDDSESPFDSERQPSELQENEDFAKDNELEVNECDDLCLGTIVPL
jgi:hypothetical protein